MGLLQVLILVLMEDTLRGIKIQFLKIAASRLNPCFNGRYSQSLNLQIIQRDFWS